ncbi:CRISPR-associated endonuclease Cas2 [Parendozoicomonas haliclonae]|uniref:CRISPR-associated endoribonuclease Cas2 n=1 Tax=Parendozoicomonas haliclonae TaxID=1960125 RepID=A0A1X7AK36_9GAMM|nr:CRISPR-associated endonuclease Cas2 [Parendozoicomonas haliclonae]SMA42933.1 CRISPR-associated endoribonuclease Cas2 [Parendozoicomonas haliclonae]
MGTRDEMLAAYDVTNNKNRNKLVDQLKDLGLVPIQKSVMWGYLSKAEQSAVMRIYEELLEKTDRAFLIRANLTKQLNKFAGTVPTDIKEPQAYDIL